MTRQLATLLLAAVVFCGSSLAQRKAPAFPTKPRPAKSAELGQPAVVIDETLSVLRKEPSLFSEAVQRMRRGRKIQILDIAEADGVKFFKVTAPPTNFGWVQSEAVFGKFRPGDEERLARLVQASDGFDQIEIAAQFFTLYPDSKLRPPILLLFGDLLEAISVKLSKDATSRLNRKEMAASAAPLHSYYLNFVSLDRYRKLGVTYLFNPATKLFHYDGASWNEILTKYPTSPEADEARKRLETLKVMMEKQSAK
jgi:hypothetical protein